MSFLPSLPPYLLLRVLEDGVNDLGSGPARQGDAQLCLCQAHRRQGDEDSKDAHGGLDSVCASWSEGAVPV
jgi:hypothetical protein